LKSNPEKHSRFSKVNFFLLKIFLETKSEKNIPSFQSQLFAQNILETISEKQSRFLRKCKEKQEKAKR
jgi:hypothetical protein